MADETNVDVQVNEPNDADDVKTYTEEQVNEIISKRISREKDKAKKELDKAVKDALEEERKEQKRLSDLSEEERENERIRQTEAERDELKQKLLKMELSQETTEELNKQGLPIEFKTFLMGVDAETTLENIKVFKENYDAAIKAEVDKLLKGTTPKSPANNFKIGDTNKVVDRAEMARKNRIIKE